MDYEKFAWLPLNCLCPTNMEFSFKAFFPIFPPGLSRDPESLPRNVWQGDHGLPLGEVDRDRTQDRGRVAKETDGESAWIKRFVLPTRQPRVRIQAPPDFLSILLSLWTVLRWGPFNAKQWISQMQLAVKCRAKYYKKEVFMVPEPFLDWRIYLPKL